ncbi:patatin-like phospholipase family protein [Bacillaceae bacterium Marseille-Q3522]|nr:patatin-like phospholipase family protein [Bacillaceae bacterium Marseille-Q3522]
MYIDGVFSGGGIKGFALVGAYEVMEKRGLQFERLAGTSAGSIIAALIAAKYTSKEIKYLLDELDLKKFLDPVRTIFPFAATKWLLLYWRLGLYKGNELEKWLSEKLAFKGLRTFADLPPQTLRVVASDLTNGRLMVLPDELPQYGCNPAQFPIAKAIRMSSSLPYFFEPVKLKSGNKTSIIVDGGVLSNFPMWLFDKDNVKKIRPVLGIQLSPKLNERKENKIKNAIQLFTALFETMKDAHDSRYISRKHAKNIIFIPTDGILATDFELTKEEKNALLQLGKEHAEQFFRTWTY